MTVEERKHELYLQQKQWLDTFWEDGANSRTQYPKSRWDLTVKMCMEPTRALLKLYSIAFYDNGSQLVGSEHLGSDVL